MLQYAALIDSPGVERVQRVEAAGLDRHLAFGVGFYGDVIGAVVRGTLANPCRSKANRPTAPVGYPPSTGQHAVASILLKGQKTTQSMVRQGNKLRYLESGRWLLGRAKSLIASDLLETLESATAGQPS
jgi:hypothetical protein